MSSPDTIVDNQDVIHNQKMLEIHRKNLMYLLLQAAQYGGELSAPLDRINLITDVRKNIQQIKDTLRSYGVPVEDKPYEYGPLRQALDKALAKNSSAVTETERTRLLRRADFAAELLRGAQVLWVDDHPINNLNERQILRSYGVFIDLARSTEEALDMLQAIRYDLIVSDMGRQGIKDEGLRLLETIPRITQPRPLIFYTIYSPEMRQRTSTAFAMTNRPDQLLHYIIDVLERERI